MDKTGMDLPVCRQIMSGMDVTVHKFIAYTQILLV